MSVVPLPVELPTDGTELRPQYIAVRKGGSGHRNCIFQHWDDAQIHLEGTDVQYSFFESINDAVKYAFDHNLDLSADNDTCNESVSVANLNESRVMNSINDSILESMDAENIMEQILPSTSNLLRMPPVHDDFISLAHDAAAAMGREEQSHHLSLADAIPHEQQTDSSTQPSITQEDTQLMIGQSQTSQTDPNMDDVLPNVELAAASVAPQLGESSEVTANDLVNTPSSSKKRKRGVKQKRKEEKIRNREMKREMEWNIKYNLLATYAAQHGTCSVPIKPENNTLNTWINHQRIEYRNLRKNDISKLTASQIQKLNDIGLKFTAKRRYASWEQRMEELKMFKEINGHARVPVNHPELGSWVHAQRAEYKKYINKTPKTKMTTEKLEQMLEVGFIFEVAKKSQQYDSRSNAKSWEDRFAELKDFKETFGHTVVPQHYPNLGWWVNTQRKERKKLKAGKKTSLTIERCLKLTEIGFVFDASNKRGSANYAFEERED